MLKIFLTNIYKSVSVLYHYFDRRLGVCVDAQRDEEKNSPDQGSSEFVFQHFCLIPLSRNVSPLSNLNAIRRLTNPGIKYRIKFNMKQFVFILIMVFFTASLLCCSSSIRRNPEEKDGMVVIPKGKFTMGLDAGEINARSAHDVYLDTYMIDKYEISAAEFARFLNEKGNPEGRYFSQDTYSTIVEASAIPGEAGNTKENPEAYAPRKGFENFPANNVSWFGAYTYCQWKGKRLPTEAEWEKAARDNDGRIYPWGNSTPDDSKARFNQKWEEKGLNVMVPVDSLPGGASYYGVYNMAGNVWEWVDDWFKRDYCLYCPEENKCIPCREGSPCDYCPKERPAAGHFKVLRGGSWYEEFGGFTIRSVYRYWLEPEDRFLNTGFRCAK
jgi:formylglycine-generating enzyme required for sulfatase activity